MAKQTKEGLESEKRSSEKAKISLGETVILVSASALSDILEPIPFLGFVVGLATSCAIILWSIMRNAHGRFFTKRVVALLISFLGDSIILLGALPIRTVSLIITIWINNHVEEKNLKRIVSFLGKV